MIYNTIKHDIRNKANLSLLDYCILESIYILSTSDKAKYKTWCNAAKSNFEYLASSRTIVSRFNELENLGWLEFKDEKRFLKRTTAKYYDSVYSYILGVKKLHGEEVAPMKELHPRGEEVAPLGVKELHPRGEEVAPNNTIYKDIENNIEKEREKALALLNSNLEILQKKFAALESENFALQAEKEKEKKVAAKKEKGTHSFPDPTHRKANIKIPPHVTDSQNLKPYEVALASYKYPQNWTENTIKYFLFFCESRHIKTRGVFGANNVSSLISKINDLLRVYEAKNEAYKVEECVKMSFEKNWSAIEMEYYLNATKKHEQTNNQPSTKGKYQDFADNYKP